MSYEKQQQLQQAMDLIREAMELVDDALCGTRQERHYDAYGKYGFNQLLGDGNPYDGSIPKLIKSLNENDEQDED